MKLGIFLAITIVGFFVVYSSMDEDKKIDDSTKTTIEEQKKETTVKKNIEILYLEDDNKKDEETIKQSKNTTAYTKTIDTTYEDPSSLKGDEAVEYLEKHNLKEVTMSKDQEKQVRYKVYADITPKEAKKNKDKMTPPLAPALVSGVMNSGQTYTVVVDGDVHAQSKRIIVADTENDTIHEMSSVKEQTTQEDTKDETEEVETQDTPMDDIEFTMPPSPGQ